MIARTASRQRFAAVQPWISTATRLALGGVFLAAGGLKVVDPQASVRSVAAYELLPGQIAVVVGWGLPFLEIVLGLVLVVGAFVRGAAIAATILLLVFIGAVLSAVARGLSIDCGCFGGGGPVMPSDVSYGPEIARDLVFLAMAGWLVWQPVSRFALEHPPGEEHP